MKPPFIHDDFLLSTAVARRLFHEVAAPLPIIDYHCHLDARQLADDHRFANLAELWVASDPYKHRAMRIAGVPEAQITGPAADEAKFNAWAVTVPRTAGNPLFHWTALELKRFFGIDQLLSPASAQAIWEAANARLREPGFTARDLVDRASVACICTSDRLLDDLSHHERLVRSGWRTRVLPSLRGDDLITLDEAWLGELEGGRTFGAFREAVRARLDAFGRLGCRFADHALDDFRYVPCTEGELEALFESRRRLDARGLIRMRSGLLRWVATEYAERGWVLQLHIGAQRRTSTRLRTLAGPAGGFATIGGPAHVPSLCALLDDLERSERLPRVILYYLNPADAAALATLTGSFAEDGVPGKVQLGPAWWYNDHDLGIRHHLDHLSRYGLLSVFIGMTTDSRSLLSTTRHEYFRRVFCDWLGRQVEEGLLPDDPSLLGELVRGVCHGNAARLLTPEQP